MTFRPPTTRPHARNRSQMTLIAVAAVVMLVVAAIAGLAWRAGSSADPAAERDTFRVRRGTFDISMPASGELAALKQIEIRNQLDSRAIITEIVPEGTFVNAGDIVLRLNDEEIRNRLRDAQDRVNVAEAALITAQAKRDIQIKTRDLAVQLAQLALDAWKAEPDGEAATKLAELQLAVETAEKEFTRLDERYSQSLELVKEKFISEDELKRDEIAKMKAAFDLTKARNQLTVYKTYQYQQDKAQKESAVEQAIIERDAEVRSANSDVESKQFQLDSAKEKLVETQQQMEYCVVRAPASGLAVYHASTQSGGMGRNEGRPPVVGVELSRNEPVIILPDTSQMVAAVKISEALVGQIQPGQRATITCDAMPDRSITGQVVSVGVMAEGGGWRDPNRRDYTVRIKLNDSAELGLKPSMRCKANIYVGRVNNALHAPIQAVFRAGGISYVYVPQGSGWAERKITPGASSELLIEALEGLSEDEIVLLRQPQPEEIVSRLPIPKQEEKEDEAGNSPPAMMEAPPQMPGADGAPGSGGGNGNGNGGMGGREGMRRGGRGGAGMGGLPGNGGGEGGTRPEGGRNPNRERGNGGSDSTSGSGK